MEIGIESIMDKVNNEMIRQDILWGKSRVMSPSEWLPILIEEVGEVSTEILELSQCEGDKREIEDRYLDELSQVAAVAIRMMESVIIDRSRVNDDRKTQGYDIRCN